MTRVEDRHQRQAPRCPGQFPFRSYIDGTFSCSQENSCFFFNKGCSRFSGRITCNCNWHRRNKLNITGWIIMAILTVAQLLTVYDYITVPKKMRKRLYTLSSASQEDQNYHYSKRGHYFRVFNQVHNNQICRPWKQQNTVQT